MAKDKKIEVVRERSGVGFIVTLLFIVIALVAGFFGLESHHRRMEIRDLRAEIERARSGTNELIGAYIDRVRDMQKADIREQVESFGEGIRSDIARVREGVATAEDISRVSRRIDGIASARGADFALLTSAALLNDKIGRGLAFKDELAMVRAAGVSDPATIEALVALEAIEGRVKSASELASEFGKIADDVVFFSKNPTSEKPGVFSRLWLRARGAVKIRRLDSNSNANSTDAIVARVERFLAAGDVAGATDEFGKLREISPSGFNVGSTWYLGASEKTNADRHASGIYMRALERAASGLESR